MEQSSSLTLVSFLKPVSNLIMKFIMEMHYMEQFFISLHGLYSFTCQLIFFIICEWVLGGHAQRLKSQKDKSILLALTSILFYSVFSYFVRRIKEVCVKGPRHPLRSRATMGNYIKFICRIILEWVKALVVVICLREQGIHYEPSLPYFMLTFLYYLSTEKLLTELLTNCVEMLSLESLENLEHLYVPLALNAYTCIIGFIFQLYLLTVYRTSFILLSCYFIAYLRLKDTYFNYWKVIEDERKVYSSFRAATQEEIEEWDDICAVCLHELSRAKITPCKHLFHPVCLKQCLKVSFLCPLCKQNFASDLMEMSSSNTSNISNISNISSISNISYTTENTNSS